MDQVDNAILETALTLLSEMERKGFEAKVTLAQVEASLPYAHKVKCNKAYIQLVLDEEFSKRYNGKEIVYFLKVKV